MKDVTRLLVILFLAFLAGSNGQTSKADPIVGEWKWFNGTRLFITADGQFTSSAGKGVWEFSKNKEIERKYVLTWEGGLFADFLTLSRDGKHLEGKSAAGQKVTGDKADTTKTVETTPLPFSTAKPGFAPQSLKGNFLVSVDDEASIYLNGVKIHGAGINESRSPELEVKLGDRIVVHLHNATAGHRFMMVFVSTDQATVISFRARDFRIVPDADVNDFSNDQYQKWYKQPKPERQGTHLAIKSYSDWVWGNAEHSALAAVVTAQMITQRPK